MKLYPKNKKTKMEQILCPSTMYIYIGRKLSLDMIIWNSTILTKPYWVLNHEYYDDLCHYIYFKKYIFLFIFLAWRKRDFGCWLRQTSLMPILIKFCQFQIFFSFFCKVFYHLRRRLYLFWWKAAFILKFKWRTCWWMMILASSFLFFFFSFFFLIDSTVVCLFQNWL